MEGEKKIKTGSKILIVAKWEFLEKIRTRAFIISLVVSPIIVLMFALGPTLLLTTQKQESPKVFGVLDSAGLFLKQIRVKAQSVKLPDGEPAYLIKNLYWKNDAFGILKKNSDSLVVNNFIDAAIVITYNNHVLKAEFRSGNTGNLKDIKRIETIINQIRVENEFIKRGVDTSLIKLVDANIELSPVKIEKGGKETKSDFLVTFLSSLVLILALMMTILSSGGLLIRSLVEEKSNRLIEILVSSCTPGELLGGKVIGLCLVGLLQAFVWAVISMAFVGSHLLSTASFTNILPMLLFFILGFFFYSALFVGIGSIATTEQEAQMINGYLVMFLLVPIIFSVSAIENPSSFLMRLLSYIPFTTPTVMILRLNTAQIEIGEIITASVILLVSTILAILFAAKIFRIGILSYGKMPKAKEIIQWLKEK